MKGWLDGNTGNTAPNVGNKYLRRRKARIGQLGNGKGLTWFLVLANRVFFFWTFQSAVVSIFKLIEVTGRFREYG